MVCMQNVRVLATVLRSDCVSAYQYVCIYASSGVPILYAVRADVSAVNKLKTIGDCAFSFRKKKKKKTFRAEIMHTYAIGTYYPYGFANNYCSRPLQLQAGIWRRVYYTARIERI